MPDELYLPLIAAAVLLWYLVSALRQQRTGRSAGPRLIWREATAAGWSEREATPDRASAPTH